MSGGVNRGREAGGRGGRERVVPFNLEEVEGTMLLCLW